MGDVNDYCRLCSVRLRSEANGQVSHSKLIFPQRQSRPGPPGEKSMFDRLRDLGLTLSRSADRSFRSCVKCDSRLRRLEGAVVMFRQWIEREKRPLAAASSTLRSGTSIEVELELEEDSDNEGSRPGGGGEKRKEHDEDTEMIPPKKMKLCRTMQDRRTSTTEVIIRYATSTVRVQCDPAISGVINNLAQGRFATAARLAPHHKQLMAALQPVLTAVVDGECRHLCNPKHGFALWKTSAADLKRFSLDDLREDLEQMAPLTFAVMCTIAGEQHRHACAAAAIALRGRESRMSAFTHYLNRLLHRGGARKAVFQRLSQLGITTTHGHAKRMLRLTTGTFRPNPTTAATAGCHGSGGDDSRKEATLEEEDSSISEEEEGKIVMDGSISGDDGKIVGDGLISGEGGKITSVTPCTDRQTLIIPEEVCSGLSRGLALLHQNTEDG